MAAKVETTDGAKTETTDGGPTAYLGIPEEHILECFGLVEEKFGRPAKYKLNAFGNEEGEELQPADFKIVEVEAHKLMENSVVVMVRYECPKEKREELCKALIKTAKNNKPRTLNRNGVAYIISSLPKPALFSQTDKTITFLHHLTAEPIVNDPKITNADKGFDKFEINEAKEAEEIENVLWTPAIKNAMEEYDKKEKEEKNIKETMDAIGKIMSQKEIVEILCRDYVEEEPEPADTGAGAGTGTTKRKFRKRARTESP